MAVTVVHDIHYRGTAPYVGATTYYCDTEAELPADMVPGDKAICLDTNRILFASSKTAWVTSPPAFVSQAKWADY